MSLFPILPADASLAMRLAAYVLQVMGAVGDRTRRVPAHDVARGIVPQAVYDRIGAWLQTRRLAIAAVMARLQAGKVYRPRAYAPRPGAPGAAQAGRPAPASDAPLFRGFGWLYRWAPEVRTGAGHLVELLEGTEMKAAVLAAPGPMVRAWVPLLNALGRSKPDWFPVPPKRMRRKRDSLPLCGGGSGRGAAAAGSGGEESAARTRSFTPPPSPHTRGGERNTPSAPDPVPVAPTPSPLPTMAAWTGRGPGPCRSLAEYRSPFEPPLWEVRSARKKS